MIKIVVIDRDAKLVAVLRDYLQLQGFAVGAASDAEDGVREALSAQCDFIILGDTQSRSASIDALCRVRASSSKPILMLTGFADDTDRVIGLELGADDYVCKPCTERELVARVRAIMRRGQSSDKALELNVGELMLCPEKRQAQWAGHTLELTSVEFNLLEVLVLNAGKTISKQYLAEQGMGRPFREFDRSIDVHMSSIRRKLDSLSNGNASIKSVFRRGYQLLKE